MIIVVAMIRSGEKRPQGRMLYAVDEIGMQICHLFILPTPCGANNNNT